MQINDALNLVVPIRTEGVTISAFHTPISREVFEANYRLIAAVRSDLDAGGVYYQMGAGPRIAAMAMRDRARRDAEARGDVGPDGKPTARDAESLFAEIKRLTLILAPSDGGWQPLPVDAAIQHGTIDADEWDETLAQIVFFTCYFALARKAERATQSGAIASLLNASTTSSALSEYVSSLPQSTTRETLHLKAASSVPC